MGIGSGGVVASKPVVVRRAEKLKEIKIIIWIERYNRYGIFIF